MRVSRKPDLYNDRRYIRCCLIEEKGSEAHFPNMTKYVVNVHGVHSQSFVKAMRDNIEVFKGLLK
jgi:hypothetical protein